MARRYSSLLLLLGCACAGHSGPGPVPPAAGPAATAPAAPAPSTRPDGSAPPVGAQALPAAPDWNAADSSLDQSVAAFLQRAADSVADAEALEALAEASPDSASDEAASGAEEPPPFGPEVATWDIDVATYSSHDRVQYYLDFFQTTARDRMTIWLQRMPRYDWMIRSTMKKYGVPEDMVYLALIESGFSNTAVSRSRAVGMWQF
ncbi:MAG: transglycosylase SLT domain-containing protein, partial [Gemmatimonadales bacterium]